MDILAFSPFIFTSESVPYPTCDIKSPQTSGFTKRPPSDYSMGNPCHATLPMRSAFPVQFSFHNWRN